VLELKLSLPSFELTRFEVRLAPGKPNSRHLTNASSQKTLYKAPQLCSIYHGGSPHLRVTSSSSRRSAASSRHFRAARGELSTPSRKKTHLRHAFTSLLGLESFWNKGYEGTTFPARVVR